MTHPNLKVTNTYLSAAEEAQSAIITITGIEDSEDNTKVTICMEGDARLMMRMLCGAQEQLLEKYGDDEDFKKLGRKHITPILEGLTSDEQKALMQAIHSRLDTQKRPPFWDLMGHLRRFVK